MEIPRVLIWTVLLLCFGAIMASATNYIVINNNVGGGNGSASFNSTGTPPYIPYFNTSSLLANSPIYVQSDNKVIVNGTANFTGTTANTTFAGDVQIIGKLYGGSPVKIAGGINVTGLGTFQDIVVSSCVGCAIINGTTINATNITAQNFIALNSLTVNQGGNISFPNQSLPLNVLYGTTNDSCPYGQFQTSTTLSNGSIFVGCAPGTASINESGIARNYTIVGNVSGVLPDWDMITIKGVLTTTSNSSLLLNFNGDTNFNYTYRRVQGLTFLYQAVTVNPQRNVTLEQYESNKERSILMHVYRTGTDITGDFQITGFVTDSYGAYNTLGTFTYKNSSSVNTFSIAPAVTGTSYLIVTSENR